MTATLPPNEGARFGVTLTREGGSLDRVDDDRNNVVVPDGMSVCYVANEGVEIRAGATGRAAAVVTRVRETTGESGHLYVRCTIERFDEESYDPPTQTRRRPTVPSRVTMRGGERDVAGPRSSSYGRVPAAVCRRKH